MYSTFHYVNNEIEQAQFLTKEIRLTIFLILIWCNPNKVMHKNNARIDSQ